MRFSLRFALATALAVSALAPVSAKIYPADFMGPVEQSQPQEMMPATEESPMIEMPAPLPTTPTDTMGTPMFSTKEGMTRGQFIAALTYSLYSVEQHQSCFAEIAGGTTDYELLFADVRVDNENAAAICMAMRNGWIDGYKNGTFHPNDMMTVADGASVLVRAFGLSMRMPKVREVWYGPAIDAVHSVDSAFALKPAQTFTGIQLFRTMCAMETKMPGTFMLQCGN